MPDEPIIEFKDVTFAYDSEPVLADVSLSIPPGELVGMVGPNGGGKTTLLRLMLGLLKPQRGTVRVFGEPPENVRGRIGYVPQYADYDPKFPVSVMDIVLMGRLGRRWGSFYSREDREAARQALDDVHLSKVDRKSFSSLSGGQRQRVLIARALATRPELMLLDEPTANVDTMVEQSLYELLTHLKERQTIVMVSHDVGVVSKIVSSVVCVNRVTKLHPTTELTGAMLQEIYEDDMALVRHDHHSS